jgi:pimeloyl-ACP methyl ester carboxylesterase
MNKLFARGSWAWVAVLPMWPLAGLAAPPAVAPPPPANAPPAAAPQPPVAPQPTAAQAAPEPAAAAPEAGAEKPAELVLANTDGVDIHAWHYPARVEKGSAPLAAAILLHDLEGSHRSVEPLAQALQAAGITVVAPDLRGHGASTSRLGTADAVDVRLLKKPDFELMAATRGGQIREQSAIRGDVESVRNWIKRQADDGDLDMNRLVVVGSGLGAAVAAAWTAEDANWPTVTKGPQGRQVRGLVLVSPSWTTRGFSINAPLGHEAVKAAVPVLLIAGRNDRDAAKVFEQLKRQRPDDWFRLRADGEQEQAKKLTDPAQASLFMVELDSPRTADALASDGTLNAAKVITKFFGMALAQPRR